MARQIYEQGWNGVFESAAEPLTLPTAAEVALAAAQTLAAKRQAFEAEMFPASGSGADYLG